MKVQELIPYTHLPVGKKSQIRSMFDRIAGHYDFLNHLLSFQMDRIWRRKAIRSLKCRKVSWLLDVASGTGDLAIQAASLNPDVIIACDISENMIEIARRKVLSKKLDPKITCSIADGEDLFFPDASFDALTIGFGIRNFSNMEKGLFEFFRVLSPQGRLVILEFSLPENRIIRWFYLGYFRKILPFIGKLFSRDPDAYSYLNKSVEAFPSRTEMVLLMEKAGFNNIVCKPLSLGLVALYSGSKP